MKIPHKTKYPQSGDGFYKGYKIVPGTDGVHEYKVCSPDGFECYSTNSRSSVLDFINQDIKDRTKG